MNRRLKAFWAKHEGWLGPVTVLAALAVGWQGGAVTERVALTQKHNAAIAIKDARIKELHDRANVDKNTLAPAVEAAVESAKAAAQSAAASALTVEQMAKEKEASKGP